MDAWAERSRPRTEEHAGVSKAIESVTSDEASATFSRATTMLLLTAEEGEVEGEFEGEVHAMETVSSLIDRLNARKSETAADIRQRETDITATEDAMAEALSDRNSENEDFKATRKDDINAVELMASAIDALTAFSSRRP